MTDSNVFLFKLVVITIVIFLVLEHVLCCIENMYPSNKLNKALECVKNNRIQFIALVITGTILGNFVMCELQNKGVVPKDLVKKVVFSINRQQYVLPAVKSTLNNLQQSSAMHFPTNVVTYSDNPIDFGELNL